METQKVVHVGEHLANLAFIGPLASSSVLEIDELKAAKEAYLKDKSEKNYDKYTQLLESLRGCTDKKAENYDESKKVDDGSCISKAVMDEAMEVIGDKLTRSQVLKILKDKQHGAFWTPEQICRTVFESYEYQQIHRADEYRIDTRNPFPENSPRHQEWELFVKKKEQELQKTKEEIRAFFKQEGEERLRRRDQLVQEQREKEREDVQKLQNLMDRFPPPSKWFSYD